MNEDWTFWQMVADQNTEWHHHYWNAVNACDLDTLFDDNAYLNWLMISHEYGHHIAKTVFIAAEGSVGVAAILLQSVDDWKDIDTSAAVD
jgi:hypothetical protein